MLAEIAATASAAVTKFLAVGAETAATACLAVPSTLIVRTIRVAAARSALQVMLLAVRTHLVFVDTLELLD